MTKNRSILILWVYTTLALMAGSALTSASANTIDMIGYNGESGDVTCDPECFGFAGTYPSGPISLDMTVAYTADPYPQAGNPSGELDRLNELLDLFDPARANVVNVNKIEGVGDGFSTNLQYFSIKKANDLFYFENTSGGIANVDLGPNTDDYSHWTEYGVSSPFPVHAAVGLFGTALIGFIGISRRRKVS